MFFMSYLEDSVPGVQGVYFSPFVADNVLLVIPSSRTIAIEVVEQDQFRFVTKTNHGHVPFGRGLHDMI